jgi:uncharacterized phage protein (TIGR02218 family)
MTSQFSFLPWCRGCLITRTDSVVIATTDWDNNFVYNGNTYYSQAGFNATATNQKADMSVDTLEIVSVLSSFVTEQDLRLKRYDDALIEIFIYNWMTGDKIRTIFRGFLGALTLNYDKSGAISFSIQANSVDFKLQQKSQLMTTRSCRHRFGDQGLNKCNFNTTPLQVNFTVDAVYSNDTFTTIELFPSNHWTYKDYALGSVTFTSGILNGLTADILSTTPTTNWIALWNGFAYPPAPGDTLILTPGCDKTIDTCIHVFSNVDNFGGQPYLPGMDTILASTTPLQQ